MNNTDIRAALYRPDQPQNLGDRVLPTEAELSTVLIGCLGRDDYLSDTVRAITKLYADQPTVAQVKAEALRELLEPIRELAEIGDSCWLSEGTRVVRVTTRKNGYTETESMIRVSDLEGLLDQIEADVKGGER